MYILNTQLPISDTRGCKSELTAEEYKLLPPYIQEFYILKELLR